MSIRVHSRFKSPVNPNAKADEDTRTAADLIQLIRKRGDEIRDILAKLERT